MPNAGLAGSPAAEVRYVPDAPPSAVDRVVAVIPGDDAAPEAMEATLTVLDSMALSLRYIFPRFDRDPATELAGADTVLFGATSGRSTAMLFHLRWGRETYANVRPTRWFPGQPSVLSHPEAVDLMIVRENLEDAYVCVEGPLADLAPLHRISPTIGVGPETMGPGAYALKVITRAGCKRVLRKGFALARGRRQRLTASAKANMLPQTDGLFLSVAREVAAEFPDVEFETLLVDDCAHRIVRDPGRFDVIVLPNLYGDLLSDMASGLVGGLGCAPSGCYGDGFAYFESVHGTAPDLTGLGTINPTATILSAAMMLDHLEMTEAAAGLRQAVERVYAAGRDLTPDVGGRGTTCGFAKAVIAAL